MVDDLRTFVAAAYRSLAALWWPLERGVAPSGARLGSLPADEREGPGAELGARLGAGDEPIELDARAWWVAGRAPTAA